MCKNSHIGCTTMCSCKYRAPEQRFFGGQGDRETAWSNHYLRDCEVDHGVVGSCEERSEEVC
ncbi:hypothetical protein BDR05DRAFT_970930 [Suillus weaverae]|nr:hypothetical protein BDR05DRAFT_970930 [Suillus weaverae]